MTSTGGAGREENERGEKEMEAIIIIVFIILWLLLSPSTPKKKKKKLTSNFLESWGNEALIEQAIWLASAPIPDRKKIEKCVKELGQVTVKDREAAEWRKVLKKLLHKGNF